MSSNLSLHHPAHTNGHVCWNTTALKLTSCRGFDNENVRHNLLWIERFQKLCQIVNLQAGCSTQLTDRKGNRLHSSLLYVLRHAVANTMFFCEGSQKWHCPPFVSFRFSLFWSCKGRCQNSVLCFVYFNAVKSASAGSIYEAEEADAVYERKWAWRESADWGWTDINTGDGPCLSFQDLITGEKNVARGDAWHRDKRGEVVSVQISNRRIKGDRGRERKKERELNRERISC